MKNYRVLSLILALVMLAAVVFPAGVFADDFVLEDEVAVEDTAEEVQIEDEYLDEPGEEVAEPVLADDESEVLIDEDAALPEEESVNEEEAQIENEVEDLETSETDEFLAGKPVVTAPEDASAAEGATVTFKVTATGTAPLSYQWQTKLVGKTTWQSTKLGGYNTATLSFPMVASYDGRQYRCVVTDKNGNKVASKAATLTLAAGLSVTDPEDASAAVGATVTFKVTAAGAAPLSYQWQTKLVGKTTWQSTKLGGYNTATLSFPMVASYDGRQYRCVVTDKNGNKVASKAATLTLASAPIIVAAPEDTEAAAGETVTFKVTATGAVPLSYQWQTKLVGKSSWQSTKLGGYNTATLSFPMVASYDGRQYRCIVTDKNGNKTVSEPATLTLAKEIEQNGVVYEKLTDTTCTVKAYKGTASTLEIPKTINGMTVTEIGEEAFMNNTGLTSIKLPETITVIRARAFKGCTNLREMK